MTLFEILLTILSAALTVETVLALVIYLCVCVSFRARKPGEEMPSPMILEVLAALAHSRRWLWFWRVLLFFPLGCVSPAYRGLRWLSQRSPYYHDLLVKCCLLTLAFLFGRSATLQEISAWIWSMCLFWLLVITEPKSGDDKDDQGGKEGEGGPDDPTPQGDAAEHWLHSQHAQQTNSSTR